MVDNTGPHLTQFSFSSLHLGPHRVSKWLPKGYQVATNQRVTGGFTKGFCQRVLTACFSSRPAAVRWVSEVRDSVQDKWPYLSLLPEQRGVQPCRAVGGVNTVVPLVIRVPKLSEGPDGNPEMALGYDVSGVTSVSVSPFTNRNARLSP